MNVEWIWIGAGAAALGFSGAAAWVASKLKAPAGADADAADERVAGGYYKPMSRLLIEDLSGLQANGFTARQIRQLRASRRRAFRSYLTDLQADFRALHTEARIMARDSAAGRADLPAELVKIYFSFQVSVLAAHGKLVAHSLGVQPAETAASLVPAEWMRQHVELLRVPSAS